MLHADLLLIDDREGVKAALRQGLETTGTIGVLNFAAKRGLLDLADAFAHLKRTSFRYPKELLQNLLARRKHKWGERFAQTGARIDFQSNKSWSLLGVSQSYFGNQTQVEEYW